MLPFDLFAGQKRPFVNVLFSYGCFAAAIEREGQPEVSDNEHSPLRSLLMIDALAPLAVSCNLNGAVPSPVSTLAQPNSIAQMYCQSIFQCNTPMCIGNRVN